MVRSVSFPSDGQICLLIFSKSSFLSKVLKFAASTFLLASPLFRHLSLTHMRFSSPLPNWTNSTSPPFDWDQLPSPRLFCDVFSFSTDFFYFFVALDFCLIMLPKINWFRFCDIGFAINWFIWLFRCSRFFFFGNVAKKKIIDFGLMIEGLGFRNWDIWYKV